jgi:hypothetical protein
MKHSKLPATANSPPITINFKPNINFKNTKAMQFKKSLFLFSLLICFTTQAQITKGNFLVGGTGGFSKYKSTIVNDNSGAAQKGVGLQIAPNVGYFVVDNFVTGVGLGYSYSNPSGNNNNSSSYSLGPFARYYFLKPEKMINPFFQASYSFSKGKSENGGKFSNSGYGLKAGTAIFFNSSVALELGINYTYSNSDNVVKIYDLSFIMGFQIHLEKK